MESTELKHARTGFDDIGTDPDLDGQAGGTEKLPKPPTRFAEAEIVNYISRLCANGRQEVAAKYFIDNAQQILGSKLNMKEKLNHLMYLPRLIQGAAGTKYGYQKLLKKAAGIEATLKGIDVPPGGAFIDLGCGAHDPLALATYYYLNGFAPCFGIDLLAPRNEKYSALSMYDIIANARSFPNRYCRAGTEPAQIQRRLSGFALGMFERGNFYGGFGKLRDEIRFEAKDIVESSAEPGSASLIASYAVLEHVSDIQGVCAHLFRLLKPGGIVFHFVDLADHRSYRGDKKFGPLSFLCEEEAPPNMNRLRAPEIVAAHQAAGFEIIKDKRGTIGMPDDVRKNLTARFRNMSVEDLSAIKLQILARRPW